MAFNEPIRNLGPDEKTSDLYNELCNSLDVLHKELVIGRPDFTTEEWCSIYGALGCLTNAVQPKVEQIKDNELK